MNTTRSVIYESDYVSNKDRKFGSSNNYYVFYYESKTGYMHPACLTPNELRRALERGRDNKEDVSPPYRSMWARLYEFFMGI